MGDATDDFLDDDSFYGDDDKEHEHEDIHEDRIPHENPCYICGRLIYGTAEFNGGSARHYNCK